MFENPMCLFRCLQHLSIHGTSNTVACDYKSYVQKNDRTKNPVCRCIRRVNQEYCCRKQTTLRSPYLIWTSPPPNHTWHKQYLVTKNTCPCTCK